MSRIHIHIHDLILHMYIHIYIRVFAVSGKQDNCVLSVAKP